MLALCLQPCPCPCLQRQVQRCRATRCRRLVHAAVGCAGGNQPHPRYVVCTAPQGLRARCSGSTSTCTCTAHKHHDGSQCARHAQRKRHRHGRKWGASSATATKHLHGKERQDTRARADTCTHARARVRVRVRGSGRATATQHTRTRSRVSSFRSSALDSVSGFAGGRGFSFLASFFGAAFLAGDALAGAGVFALVGDFVAGAASALVPSMTCVVQQPQWRGG